MAHRLPRRIPWAAHHPPAALLPPTRTIHTTNALRRPHKPAFCQARVGDPVYPPILRGYHATVQHHQK